MIKITGHRIARTRDGGDNRSTATHKVVTRYAEDSDSAAAIVDALTRSGWRNVAVR